MSEPMITAGRLRGAAESLRKCEEPFGCILRDRIARLFDEGAEEIERLQIRVVAHHEIGTLSHEVLTDWDGGPCPICARADTGIV